MTMTSFRRTEVNLRAGPVWTSFENLRLKPAENLAQLIRGVVGTLIVKNKQYRILSEDDFQELQGLASDVHRLSGGVEFLLQAGAVWEENDNLNTRRMLVTAFMQVRNSPSLPRSEAAENLRLDKVPSDQFIEDNDEDAFDFNK